MKDLSASEPLDGGEARPFRVEGLAAARARAIGSFPLAGELMVSRRVAPISRRSGGAYARNVQT